MEKDLNLRVIYEEMYRKLRHLSMKVSFPVLSQQEGQADIRDLYDNVLTHFTRREDCTMNSGRLVEEMKRMDYIVGRITSRSLVLLNESFASTTEKEGSQIAENIIQALYDSGIHVFIVTHLFAFANGMYQKNLSAARFLCAERNENGERTFKMIDHEPTETSYGLDLFREIVGV